MTDDIDQARDAQQDSVVAPPDRYLVRNNGRYCKGCRKVHDYLTVDCVPAAFTKEGADSMARAFDSHWEQTPDGRKVILVG